MTSHVATSYAYVPVSPPTWNPLLNRHIGHVWSCLTNAWVPYMHLTPMDVGVGRNRSKSRTSRSSSSSYSSSSSSNTSYSRDGSTHLKSLPRGRSPDCRRHVEKVGRRSRSRMRPRGRPARSPSRSMNQRATCADFRRRSRSNTRSLPRRSETSRTRCAARRLNNDPSSRTKTEGSTHLEGNKRTEDAARDAKKTKWAGKNDSHQTRSSWKWLPRKHSNSNAERCRETRGGWPDQTKRASRLLLIDGPGAVTHDCDRRGESDITEHIDGGLLEKEDAPERANDLVEDKNVDDDNNSSRERSRSSDSSSSHTASEN